MIFEDPVSALKGRYPDAPALLRHRMDRADLFAFPAIIALARRLPEEKVEYNAGDLPIEQDPAKTPMTGLSIEETLQRIIEANSWMVLHGVETDPQYRAAMEECLAEVAPVATTATGPMHKKLAFLFVSSPGAVTPLHFDPEHNILMQIKGEKEIFVYPQDCGLASDEDHENYHAGVSHRNLRRRPELDALAQRFRLGPGDALYVPVKAPHWVRNGGQASISFSITWRSRASDREARLRLANHALRRWGACPPPPGAAPGREAAKVAIQRLVSRLRSLARD